jgi:hypothetical protein
VLFADDESGPDQPTSETRREFPPFTLALAGEVTSEFDRALLRAGGALRLINLLVRQRSEANEIVRRLLAGEPVDHEPPTNNPDGWAGYAEIFRGLKEQISANALRDDSDPATSGLALALPDDYPAEEMRRDRAEIDEIPDLSDGSNRLADALAAMEWRRVVLDEFVDLSRDDKVLVDLTGVEAGDWESAPDASLGRGMLALNSTFPIWIRQRAGQNAHLWPGVRDQPIFTVHSRDQFDWLTTVHLHPKWVLFYVSQSGLAAANELVEAAIVSVVRTAGPEHIHIVDDGGTRSLKIPTAKEFLGLSGFYENYWVEQIPGLPPNTDGD